MAYVIAAPCIDHADQTCVSVCPVDCITADPSVDRKFYIDRDACIDCGSCESVCPNSAIFAEDRLPAQWSVFAEIDAGWYADAAWARAVVDQVAAA